MNRILIGSFTVVLLCGSLLAQSPPPNPGSEPQQQQAPPPDTVAPPASPTQATPAQATPANAAPRIAPGSVIPVQLTKSVDAKKVKQGDEVVARVTMDLRSDAGTIIVPKDTKVVGHVTEAQARSKEQKESQLAIAFDHAVLKNGEAMQMPMSIQAIIAPPNANSGNAPAAQPTTSSPTPGGSSTAPGGRPGSMGETTPSTASVPQTIGSAPAPAAAQAPQHITGDTKGVVGIANLNLSAASDATQGSVVSSEKNNVKLDDGTFLLLRVN
jgi:hypothetical protein